MGISNNTINTYTILLYCQSHCPSRCRNYCLNTCGKAFRPEEPCSRGSPVLFSDVNRRLFMPAYRNNDCTFCFHFILFVIRNTTPIQSQRITPTYYTQKFLRINTICSTVTLARDHLTKPKNPVHARYPFFATNIPYTQL